MRNLTNVNRIVIKVGTSTLTNPNGTLNEKCIEKVSDVVANLKKSGKQVSIVTCGAITAGVTKLRIPYYPTDMKIKQAAAAVGQCLLMNIYDKYFSRHGMSVGQILMTKYTTQRDDSLSNVTNTMNTLFSHGAIPIFNENDPVISDEIKLGDNDILAAHVANIMQADLLIFLTNADGLYDRDPRQTGAKIISEVTAITEEIKVGATGPMGPRSTGGMATKLSAAVMASKSAKTVILNGNDPFLILDVLSGAKVGTYFDLAR